MYKCGEFERFYFQYQIKVLSRGESLYNMFSKWDKCEWREIA